MSLRMAIGGVAGPFGRRRAEGYHSPVPRPRLRPTRWLPAEPRKRSAALAAVAALGAGGAVALMRWRLWSSGVPSVDPAPLSDWFDPAELARNREYRRGVWAMAAVGVPLAALTAIAVAALGGRWRPGVVRLARGRPWAAGLAMAGVVAAFIYLSSLLSPILIEPLFQRTQPLRDPALSAQILDLAHRAGVNADDVKVNDASARTTAANAYVSGFGGSRHIVLYDTLLRDFPPDQVRMVVAHELAHVERRHVLKGSTWGAVLAVPGLLMVFAVVGWRTGFGKAARDASGCDLVLRRLAIAAAAAAVIGTLSAPLANWVSRAYEREADWRGLQLSRDPQADIALQQGLVKRSLGVPDPPAAVRFWFGTHPAALERIALALRYQDERGR